MNFVLISSMNINYVLHIILRSSKFFGVLIFNFITRSKENQISPKKLLFGLVFTIGVITFSFSGSGKNEQSNSNFGFFCAFCAFFLDGAVTYFQGKTRNVNMPSVSSFCFMQMTNFWCFLASIIFCLMKGTLYKCFSLLLEHPDILILMISLAVLSVTGQFFTFDHINRFGPVSLSFINTLRKIVSIIYSIMFYNHPMSPNRWVGLGIIFSVLIANSFGMQLYFWLKKKIGYGKKKKE